MTKPLNVCDTHTSENSLSVKAGVKRLRRPMIWRKEGQDIRGESWRADRGELEGRQGRVGGQTGRVGGQTGES